MASTPPLQITSSPQTPATPLHGAAYDRVPVRQSSRIRQRTASHTASGATINGAASTPRGKRSNTTPDSTNPALPSSHTPHLTPKKAVRRVQVVSPESPNTEITPRKAPKASTSHLQPFLSSTTTLSEGMLPTPVKTPKKKQVSNVKTASRALFQDPTLIDEMAVSSPRKGRKTKRYNGFSLESFRAEEGDPESIQIFTDNRDKVPEVDASDSNPFVDNPTDGARAKKLAGSSKRRKVALEKPKDSQVQEAIDKDEGMVYVFRGKKVYRRFDDQGEDEEEEIDEDDLGLLGRTPGGAERLQPMRTLTRKSIKPTRLFQTEEQKAAREREKEEEAMTDVEEHSSTDSSSVKPQTKTTKRSKSAKRPANEKKTSPFDQWGRARKSQDGSTSRPAKRSASDAFDRGSPGAEVQPGPKRKARV